MCVYVCSFLSEIQWWNKEFDFYFRQSSPFSKINKLKHYIEVQFFYILLVYLTHFAFFLVSVNCQRWDKLLIFAFKLFLLDLVTENPLKLWFVQLMMFLYIIIPVIYISLIRHSSLFTLPLCPSLFQICVQFPFLSTGPQTVSFKGIIELGLKS